MDHYGCLRDDDCNEIEMTFHGSDISQDECTSICDSTNTCTFVFMNNCQKQIYPGYYPEG